MATSADNTATLSLLVQTYYSTRFIERLVPDLYLEQFAEVHDIPMHQGDEVKWTKFTDFSAVTALTEAETPTMNNVSATQVSATIEQFGDYITRSDVLSMVELDGTVMEIIDMFADQAALSIDTRIRDGLYGTSSVPSGAKLGLIYPSSIGNLSTVVATHNPTLSTIKEGVRQLQTNNVKPFEDGNYVFVGHVNVVDQLMDDSNWKDWNQYQAKETMWKGEVGLVFGCRILKSTNVGFTVSGTGTPDTVSAYFNPIFGRGCYAISRIAGEYLNTYIKTPGATNTSDPLNQRSTIGWKATFATQVLDTTKGKVIVTGD